MNVRIVPSRRSSESVEILLVEDNPGDVRLTREGFREMKLRNPLHVVGDGTEALAFLRKEGSYRAAPRPHLVLLDLDLPRLGGLEVLAAMSRDSTLNGIPVVVLTASRQHSDAARAAELGAAGFITKPVDFRQLAGIVEKLAGFWITIVAEGTEAPREATPAPR